MARKARAGPSAKKAARRPAKKAAKKSAKRPAKTAAAKPPARRAAPATKKSGGGKTPKAASVGRPGTSGKGEGHAAVKAVIAATKPEHRPILERLDALIGETVPGVVRAVKWSTPMYGLPGKGWIASTASFKEYASLGFFNGVALRPSPPFGESKTMRRVNIASMAEFDEKRFRSWIEQAAKNEGWGKVG